MDGTVAAVVTVGWKWLAILIGLGALGLIEVAIFIGTDQWNPWILVLDDVPPPEPKRASTSKFQWLLWLAVVLFAYVTLWVLRARQGDFSALPDIPTNVMVVLGISTGTAAVAKGIAVSNEHRRARAAAAVIAAAAAGVPVVAPPPGTPPPKIAPPAGTTQGILVDDATNAPDLAKVQMVGFTFVAIAIFIATLIHQIASSPPLVTLPDIDSSLMVLMGISQGGYLAKKIVSGTG
jgi:hypothetical protein